MMRRSDIRWALCVRIAFEVRIRPEVFVQYSLRITELLFVAFLRPIMKSTLVSQGSLYHFGVVTCFSWGGVG